MEETNLGDLGIDGRINIKNKVLNLLVPNKAGNVLKS
jgi:hypothetical protein